MDEPNFASKLFDMFASTGIGFLWFFILAVWGGTASYLGRIKKMKTPFSIMELIGEWTISAFAGIVTAFLCYEMQFSFFATAALTGIAGHMGGRAIALFELMIETQWSKWFGRSHENRPD